jgi:tetratricopeptide (TPR) repeat protein
MFAEGRAIGEEGLQIAEAVAHPPSVMVTSHGIGLLCLRHGDLPTALPPLERAVGICHEADLPAFFPQTAEALGAAYTLAGRVAVAVPLLTQAVEQATAMGRVDVQAICGLALGEAQLLAGRQEEAHALADRALALAHEHQERSRQAYALCLLGEIAAPALTDQPPAIYGLSMFVEVGGLMSYGPSFVDLHRRVAIYVDKLLKSAKPADLPVEQPRKFEFVINLKTPQALGLTILPTLLLQADEMIR